MENFLNDLREYARGNELYSIQLIFNETLTEAFTVAVPGNKGDEKKLKNSKSGKIPKTKLEFILDVIQMQNLDIQHLLK